MDCRVCRSKYRNEIEKDILSGMSSLKLADKYRRIGSGSFLYHTRNGHISENLMPEVEVAQTVSKAELVSYIVNKNRLAEQWITAVDKMFRDAEGNLSFAPLSWDVVIDVQPVIDPETGKTVVRGERKSLYELIRGLEEKMERKLTVVESRNTDYRRLMVQMWVASKDLCESTAKILGYIRGENAQTNFFMSVDFRLMQQDIVQLMKPYPELMGQMIEIFERRAGTSGEIMAPAIEDELPALNHRAGRLRAGDREANEKKAKRYYISRDENTPVLDARPAPGAVREGDQAKGDQAKGDQDLDFSLEGDQKGDHGAPAPAELDLSPRPMGGPTLARCSQCKPAPADRCKDCKAETRAYEASLSMVERARISAEKRRAKAELAKARKAAREGGAS